jgi:hypothetical protein
MNVYTLGAVVINGTTIKGIQKHSIKSGIEMFSNRAGGAPDPSFRAGKTLKPVGSLTTTDVAAVLTLTSGFLPVAVGTTADFYHLKKAHGGNFAGTSVHEKHTFNDGLIIPRRLSASHGAEATIDLDVYVTWDGSNDPWIITDNNALPSNSQVVAEKYTLGPMSLGSTLYELRELSIDTQIREFVDGHSGEAYPRFACMMERDMQVTIRSLDLSLANVIGEAGGSQASLELYLTKLTANSMSRVANATAEHIQFAVGGSYTYVDSVDATQSGESELSAMICPVWDGTNEPIVVDTTAAIAA